MAARCSMLQMDGTGRGTRGSRHVLQHRSHTAICICIPAASQPLKRSCVYAKVGGSEQWQLGSLHGFKSGEEKLFCFEN